MERLRTWSILGLVLGCVGCADRSADDGSASTGAEGSETEHVHGNDQGDGDGDPGDGDPGDGDPGDGDPGDGDGDGDGDGEGCEPQDAVDPTPDVCDEVGDYAWDGLVCRRLCDCEGVDCGALYPSARACLEAYDEVCGNFDFSTCPFDLTWGPTMVTGSSPQGSASYRAASFGLLYTDLGEPRAIFLRLAPSDLELGNYLAYVQSPQQVYEGIVAVDNAPAEVGVHAVNVSVLEPWEDLGSGTLTITTIDVTAMNSADHILEATLELDSNGWLLSGPVAIHGCDRLHLYEL